MEKYGVVYEQLEPSWSVFVDSRSMVDSSVDLDKHNSYKARCPCSAWFFASCPLKATKMRRHAFH